MSEMFGTGARVKLNTPHGKLEVDDGRRRAIDNGTGGTVMGHFNDQFVGVCFDIPGAGQGKRTVIPCHWVEHGT